jgi:carboxymethylenebutenolidase
MQDIRAAAIALYDRFTHEGLDRREFMAQLTRIAGSAAAANALLAAIAASPAAAAVILPRPAGARAGDALPVTGSRRMSGYVASRRCAPGAACIHHRDPRESRPQRAYPDVARRLAIAGYRALAPDFLSLAGGTPADEDAARARSGSSTSASPWRMPSRRSPC